MNKYLKKGDVLEKIRSFIKNKLDNDPEFFLNNILLIDNDYIISIILYDIKNKKYIIDISPELEDATSRIMLPIISINESIKLLNEFDCFVSTTREPYSQIAYIYKPLLKKIIFNNFEDIQLINSSNQVATIFFTNCIFFNINMKKIKDSLSDSELKVFTEKINFLNAKQMKNDFELAEKSFETAKKSLQSAKNKYEKSLKKLSAEKRLLLEIDEE